MNNTLRHKYGTTFAVTVVVSSLLMLADLISSDLDIAKLTLGDSGIRAAVFGSLIALAGLILTVMLGVLAVLTTLEERPIVKLMKQLNRYHELIYRLIGPVTSVFVLASLSIFCIVVPAVTDASMWDFGARSILVSSTMALALGVMVQTASVAKLLAAVMLHKPAEPGISDTPEAARARLRPSKAGSEITSRESRSDLAVLA